MKIATPHSKISRYEILGELGRGDMGVVYKARDPLIERLVALKTIGVALRDAEAAVFRQRFFREARSAGGLNHPNIVIIHDVGESVDVAYIAMEYLGGRSLREILDSGTVLPVPMIIDIAAQVADGLAFAHGKAIVHRDIKPANIMVLDNGVVKITDFGIASLPSGTRTIAGTVFGSPWYISPERLRGDRADGRTDIFSLGAVLHEMLTGSPPFTAVDLDSLFLQILNVMPAAPSTRNRNISPALDAIVAKAMAKNAEDRFRDAGEMAAALRALPVSGALTPPELTARASTNPDVLPWRDGLAATAPVAPLPGFAAKDTVDAALVPMLEAPVSETTGAGEPVIPLGWRRRAWIALPVLLLAVVLGNALWPRSTPETVRSGGGVAAGTAPTPGSGVSAQSRKPADTAPTPLAPAPVPATPSASTAAPSTPSAPAPAVAPVVKPSSAAARVPLNAPVAPPTLAKAGVTVSVAVAPWGEVYVNGRKAGVSPPLTDLKLAPGIYTIEIRNTTFPPYRTTLDLPKQAGARIRHKFQ